MIPYLNSSLFNTTTWNRNLVIHFPISCFKLVLLKSFQMEILELPCDNADAANNRASLSDKSTEATGRKPRPPINLALDPDPLVVSVKLLSNHPTQPLLLKTPIHK